MATQRGRLRCRRKALRTTRRELADIPIPAIQGVTSPNIASGTAVRFEPGQTRTVTLVPFGGSRVVYGFQQKIMGRL